MHQQMRLELLRAYRAQNGVELGSRGSRWAAHSSDWRRARHCHLNDEEEPLDAMPVETPLESERSATEGSDEIFDQFQSLQISVAPQNRLICVTDSESPAAEAFRLFGVRLRDLRRRRPLRKVLITSTIPQEGKSMVSANLACTLALRAPEKTILIEGDLRRPSLSQLFGIGSVPGLNRVHEAAIALS